MLNNFQEQTYRAMSDAHMLLSLCGAWTDAIDGHSLDLKYRGEQRFRDVSALAMERDNGADLIAEAKAQAEEYVRERDAASKASLERLRSGRKGGVA